jgi:hypothetical protein
MPRSDREPVMTRPATDRSLSSQDAGHAASTAGQPEPASQATDWPWRLRAEQRARERRRLYPRSEWLLSLSMATETAGILLAGHHHGLFRFSVCP